MPTFTSSPEDRAFEQLMKRVPNFEPDPPEAAVIQWYLDRRKQKGRRKRHDLPRKSPSGNL